MQRTEIKEYNLIFEENYLSLFCHLLINPIIISYVIVLLLLKNMSYGMSKRYANEGDILQSLEIKLYFLHEGFSLRAELCMDFSPVNINKLK